MLVFKADNIYTIGCELKCVGCIIKWVIKPIIDLDVEVNLDMRDVFDISYWIRKMDMVITFYIINIMD